ncbi:MAG: HAD family hydrolase [Bacteroidia bacterium]|nr:HAD family hydrolase [Bacteroidia bacterium]NNF31975.1 HAD family hydrolase [Flavobacteriaceae bacterium]MBT8276187.1 HAD family hydrolase [Bacteroidia bacterium]NNJ83065.1 HAD family hydrolase [Flavobacteriaceae bacterium]NNK52962.1 HAD family hydrolase [Flavobacteriaceae bacterium]
MLRNIKAIAFDADDTLWVNEPFFRNAEKEFCELMQDYLDEEQCNRLLFEVEMQNLPLYGYGIKPFTLSLIEAAIRFSDGKVPISAINTLIERGKDMLQEPIELLDGIKDTLQQLNGGYRLVMATKGDLLDQERKLIKSGLEPYFHHIEIVSDKTEVQYRKLVNHLDVKPEEFLMVGNSVKSDILPVLNIGAHAFHIPYHTTWIHEEVKEPVEHPNFRLLNSATEMLNHLGVVAQ